ncbi:MAG: RimK family alpha-L-glutamate ligase [Candidatus Dormibacterales bacterium]
MPSKGGRRSSSRVAMSAITGTVAAAGPPILESSGAGLVPSGPAFAIADEDLVRALRRGAEVDRFNELARRQEELSPAELDELYGYRLRRLQSRLRRLDRVRESEDEETIRAALDDLDVRLHELRQLEAARQAAGLPIADQIDLSSRGAAVDRLLELSRRRQPGLIAGSENPPPQPTGRVRLRQVAFRPSPDDVPVYVLARASIPSDAVARNVEAVAAEGAQVHLVHEASEIPRGGDRLPLVLNWGGGEAMPADLVSLNRPESVRISSDQVESLRRLGELAPRTVLRPDDTGLLGTEQVVAKRRHGARGSGKAVIWADAGWSERVRYDLFQEFVPARREYRVSVLSGRVVSAYLKRPPEGTSPEELRPEWSFEQVHMLPAAVASTAREAARRIGLDYSGVDVVEDLRSGRVLCLEANAAPGMSAETLRNLYAQIQQTLRGRTARAS